MKARPLAVWCLASIPMSGAGLTCQVRQVDPGPPVIAPDIYHLGDTVTDWPEAPAAPEGRELRVAFDSVVNPTEWTLRLRAFHVDNDWWIELNGTRLGPLRVGAEWQTNHVEVPPGAVTAGANVLRVVPARPHADDILVGDIRLVPRSIRQIFDLRPVTVRVSDSRGQPLPAKVTVADAAGEAPGIHYAERRDTAVRPGIVYTGSGTARVEIPAGTYTFWASRGMEWGLARATVQIGDGGADELRLVIDREVDTSGYIACDSHIHSRPGSDHGDAMLPERLVTLAAEGVELAVATDHNHHTDFRPTQEELGLTEAFTSVTGNEVTTPVGHMNAFPLDPADEVPNHRLTDWVKLVEEIKSHGARVVVLNHPRWPEIHTGPFGTEDLDRLTGEFADQRPFPFDGIEVINSTTAAHGPLFLFRDWFALRNHGHAVKAVGTSDSHTVGDPVGQGRTYLRSATDRASEIDVDAALDAMLAGQSSISLGMFGEVEVQGRSMGQQVAVRERRVTARFRVAAPSWVRPRRAMAFLNGVMVGIQPIPAVAGEPTDVTLEFDLRTPAHDAYLVLVALGDGVGAPFWRTLEDFTVCATNPVFLDVDGDGQVLAPRPLAQRILAEVGTGPEAVRDALREVDDAVAVAILSLVRRAYEAETPGALRVARDRLQALVDRGDRRPVLTEYLAGLPPVRDD